MGLVRGIGRLLAIGLGAIVLLPALALVPAALVERGPAGEPRSTILFLGLTAWDPFLRGAMANSVALAAGVALGSTVLGVALASATTRRQFWGRAPLAALATAPLAVPPLFAALGLRAWLGAAPTESGWMSWLALVWVELAFGVPIVARAAAACLHRIDPACDDAARVAGANRWRTWRNLYWPLVRPAAARAAGTVFALTLFEPGAPLVLGLRRTLAVQAVEAATRSSPGSAPMAATLALTAWWLAAAGRSAFRVWGRSAPSLPAATSATKPSAASGSEAVVLLILLATWSAVSLAPALGLGLLAASRWGVSGLPTAFRGLWHDGEALGIATHSLLLGGAAGAIALVVASASRRRRPGTPPPLAIGIGALMLPGLLEMAADWRASSRPDDAAAHVLRLAADGLDPFRAPGVLLAWAVAAAQLRGLARDGDGDGGRYLSRARARRRRVLVEAARVLGASRRRARREAAGPRLAFASGPTWFLASTLAATDTAAALVLSPTTMAMPVGPGVLLLAGDPGGLAKAAALALLAIALNLAALAWSAHADRRGA